MATIVNTNLSGATLTYNGVQFGGADAGYKSLPPSYQFVGTPVYDPTGRSLLYIDVTVQVRCIFFETSEFNMTVAMAQLQQALSAPAKQLRIAGLGYGFYSHDLVNEPNVDPAKNYFDIVSLDIGNGPKPGPLQMTPIGGQLSWELAWSINFQYMPCLNDGTQDVLTFQAFNFSTTWNNDFEGLTTRTISGMVQIAGHRNYAGNNKLVLAIAEQTRGNLVVLLPVGFKRVQNSWNEAEDKRILRFSITDQQLEGDPLPDGVTQAKGSFSFSAGDGKGGFAQSICALQMAIKTAPNVHRDMAGKLFLAAAIAKQASIQAGLPTGKMVMPIKLSITNGKFDDARQTECSIVWMVAGGCLNAMLSAAGIWEPVSSMIGTTFGANQTYSTWVASMAALWGNRGTSGIQSSASEAVIIDICDGVVTKTIGATSPNSFSVSTNSLPSFTCPAVPTDGGWITFDMEIKVLRKDDPYFHKKAASFVPSLASGFPITDPIDNTSIPLGGSLVSQGSSDYDVVEQQGYPSTYVAVKFRGLRFVNKPYIPSIKSIGGITPVEIDQSPNAPYWAFDSFGCPVWAISGYRIYRVPGTISAVQTPENRASCGAAPTPTTGVLATGNY